MIEFFNPKLIALCGPPKAGKSTVQKILHETYGIEPHDDARLLRQTAMRVYGFTWEQVSTQEGKASIVEIAGKRADVRHFMGELGLAIERIHGSNFFPWRELEHLKSVYGPNFERGPILSFGSARLEQPRFFRENGALVIEVLCDKVQASRNPYDVYDGSPAHIVIRNPGTTPRELAFLVREQLDPWLLPEQEIA